MKTICFALILLMINVCLGVKQCDYSRCAIGCQTSRSITQLTTTAADDIVIALDQQLYLTCKGTVNNGGTVCDYYTAPGQIKCDNNQDINDAFKQCGLKCYGDTPFSSQLGKDYASCMKGCYESGNLIKVCFALLGFILILLF